MLRGVAIGIKGLEIVFEIFLIIGVFVFNFVIL